ncbi:hypothetical protein ES703_102311 [subsurface metagenome]
MYGIVRCAIDLIDAPVVSRAPIKALGGSIAIGTLGDAADAVVDVVKVLTKVNFVPVDWGRKFSRRPAKDNIPRHVCRLISRGGLFGHSQRCSETQRIINRRFNQCISIFIK